MTSFIGSNKTIFTVHILVSTSNLVDIFKKNFFVLTVLVIWVEKKSKREAKSSRSVVLSPKAHQRSERGLAELGLRSPIWLWGIYPCALPGRRWAGSWARNQGQVWNPGPLLHTWIKGSILIQGWKALAVKPNAYPTYFQNNFPMLIPCWHIGKK